MKKNKLNLNLERLKDAAPLAYTSKFNFATPEIELTQSEKDSLIKNESIFVKKFKEYSASKYEMCKALYEIQVVLKQSRVFVEWYKYMGLTKDRVYELLNRYKLYTEFTGDKEKIEWVSSLSELAVTHLSRKDVEQEYLYEVFESGLKKAADIEIFLEDKKRIALIKNSNSEDFQNNLSPVEQTIENKEDGIEEAEIVEPQKTYKKDEDILNVKTEFKNSIEKTRKLIFSSDNFEKIEETKKIIAEYKSEILKMERILIEHEEKLVNENQMKLIRNEE